MNRKVLIFVAVALYGVVCLGTPHLDSIGAYAGSVRIPVEGSGEWNIGPERSVGAPDGLCDTCSGARRDVLFGGFDLALPYGVVPSGLKVTLWGARIRAENPLSVQLAVNGAPRGDLRQVYFPEGNCASVGARSLGGETDTWGIELTDTVIASDLEVRVNSGGDFGWRYIDAVRVDVYFTKPYCYVRFDGELDFTPGSRDQVEDPSYVGVVSTASLPFSVDTNLAWCDFTLGFTPFQREHHTLPTTMTYSFGDHRNVELKGPVYAAPLTARRGEHEGSLYLTVARSGHTDPAGTYEATVYLKCVGL